MARPTWRKRIERLTPDCEFAPPAPGPRLEAAEQALGVAFPAELRSLLTESNGVAGEYRLGLIWSVERIQSDNTGFRSDPTFRELYMPFEPLLFFADAGNGDLFAFSILAGEVRRPDIFAWNHENDSRSWVAPSLERYLEWWLSGRFTL